MLFALAACAPDNIKSPIQPDPEPETSAPETSTKPETEPEKEDTTVLAEPVTDTVQDNTEPETETKTDTAAQTESGTKTEPTTENQAVTYIPADKKQNKDVKPTLDIDTLSYLKLKTADLKDKTISMFVTKDGAFNAGDKTETAWLDALGETYGITVKYTVRSDSMLYPAQLIASKAGTGPDLITAKVKSAASALSLMQSVLELEENVSTPFSKTVFDITGGKLFTGMGNSRMLWYNKSIIKDDAPYTLFCADSWTTDVMNATFISAKTTKTAMLENKGDWLSFLSTGTEQVSGYTAADGAVMMITSDTSLNAAKEYEKLFQTENALVTEDQTFIKGNVAFTYTDTPATHDIEVGFAPLPKSSSDGSMVAELCGTGIGISKYIAEDKVDTALTFAALWSARYTESRIDTLLFDLKLAPDAAEKYMEFTEQNGRIYTADSQIADLFTVSAFPKELASSSETVYNTFYKAYDRTVLLNKRYR